MVIAKKREGEREREKKNPCLALCWLFKNDNPTVENRGVPGLKRKFVITSVCACMALFSLFLFFFFFFFCNERGRRTTETIQLLRDKKEWSLERSGHWARRVEAKKKKKEEEDSRMFITLVNQTTEALNSRLLLRERVRSLPGNRLTVDRNRWNFLIQRAEN